MGLVVKSMVGEKAKKAGVRVAGDFYDALDKYVEEGLIAAVKRCKENGRSTLRPADL